MERQQKNKSAGGLVENFPKQLSMGTSCKSLRTQGPNQDPVNFGRAECPNQAET